MYRRSIERLSISKERLSIPRIRNTTMPDDNVQSSYNQDIQRIQHIVERLSQKDCDIDKMLEYVNEAVVLIERCQQKLTKTGIQIDEALAKLNVLKGD